MGAARRAVARHPTKPPDERNEMGLKDFARRALACVVALSLAAAALVALPGCDTTPAVDVLAEHIEEVGKENDSGDLYVNLPVVEPSANGSHSYDAIDPDVSCSLFLTDEGVNMVVIRSSFSLIGAGMAGTEFLLPVDEGEPIEVMHLASAGVIGDDSMTTKTSTAEIDPATYESNTDFEFEAPEVEGGDGSVQVDSSAPSPSDNFATDARADVNLALTSLDSYLEEEELGITIADLGFASVNIGS